MTASTTVGALVRRVAGLLREAFARDDRARNADLDARLIVGHVLGLDATGLVLHAGRAVDTEDAGRALALAGRRSRGEPVARITGTKGFWTLDLALSPETLVPRPDTETLVAAALQRVRAEGRGDAPLAILALLAELPHATGLGIDRAEGAVRTARANAERHGLDGRARFAVGDWVDPLGARFDLVASNPPYIPREEIAGLAVDVRDFDPDMALNGGVDGLDAYRRIFSGLDHILAYDGMGFLEVGAAQADAVCGLAEDRGWTTLRHADLAGIDRVVEVRRGKASRQKMGLEIASEPATVATP